MAKPLYITTTLPYVNADPHIGFGVEIVQADAYARFARLTGRDVFFNTGTDEHGQKVWEKAQESGGGIQAYVDQHAASVQSLKDTLNLSYDAFIRTTDEHHIRAAQELWKRCSEKGDIEKRKYKGLYCVGCEKFLSERDLEDGKCPLHPGQEPQEVEEENYFFKLSNYQKQLEDYLSKEHVILPDYRWQEALNFVKNGLEDFSISREAEKLSWGIPVPDDDSQTMYVWFDALTNYISTLGWPDESANFTKFWQEGETIQMAGKDQVRFQSIMWQAMLLSAGIKTTDKIFYHGFVISDGKRMSKSLGNVIAPPELAERYGVDATRYLLLRHVHPTEDTDVTWARLDEWYEANLVNGLGNVVARVMKLAETHLQFPVELSPETQPDTDVVAYAEKFEFNYALDRTWERIGHVDVLITMKKPFEGVKSENADEKEEALSIITKLVRELHAVATELEPFMPETAEKIQKAIQENKKPDNLFPRLS